jgi:isoleucyl-tRNA synthetase
MSSFYLDILKDRLYTFPQNSQQRRSGQFVLSYILRVLLKIIAPILPFTSEDAYFYWNIAEKDDSVFIAPLDEEINKKWVDSAFMAHWEKILELRSQVLKEIEKKRESGSIGSSLEAEVILEFNEKDLEFCSSQIDTLKEILIVSSVMVREGNNRIIIQKAKGSKCLRCWNWSETVNKNSDYPDICDKCIKALKEDKK